MTTELRVLSPTEWDVWYGGLERAFGDGDKGSEHRELVRSLTHYDRSLGAYDGGECVGTAGSFPFRVTVPGGSLVPSAGVTMVSVAATHRRRGILTSLMRRQLDDVRERGEPLAMLLASEPAIYGRFGYGIASRRLRTDVDTSRVRLNGPAEDGDSIRLRQVAPAEGMAACEAVYAGTVPSRPGMIDRLPGWDRLQIFDRDPSAPLQCVLAERDGEPAGYALFRNRASWNAAGPDGTVELRELNALDPSSYAALWRFLFGIDLTSTIACDNRPADDPLFHLVSDPRRCALRVWDGLFLRPVDVGAALAARTYRVPVDAVLEVEDSFCPWNEGRWRLSGDPKGAVCERTADPADMVLSVRELGALYLGGTSLRELEGAGRVRTLSPAVVETASLAFGSDVAPWVPHDF
ncbi:GNAT family N-acetyltransferase [Streptomyces sp. NPDC051018]|uniref:GNAT family N-acetyltransferase n=1 Tax=Streptomyces sp. NPDC051018 TaxID=3365639 RepID=UPI0037BA4CAF